MSIGVMSALAAVLGGVWFGVRAMEAGGSAPGPLIPTFSTENIARQGQFYVGGKWVGEPGKEVMHGAMYVEVWVPKRIRHRYPVVFVVGGGGQTVVAALQTPDRRPGWAYNFVNDGYTVYMIDPPGQGRSAYYPGLDRELMPPRTGALMEEAWTGGRPPSTPQSTWPQYTKYTQWPSDAPDKGEIGDPVFDYYAKTEVQHIADYQEKLTSEALTQLLDMIGEPVVMLVNSGYAPSGWVAADARPKLIKGIIAAEPWAPPIENAERGATGPGRLWGLTNLPVHYDPPIKDPSELRPVRQAAPDAPGLIPCWVQQEPAHKLMNMEGFPVLEVSGEASYHRPYSHCVAKWLNQAGVKATFVRLEDVGLHGNGHQMMSEKNSADIARFFMQWLDTNIN